MTAVLTAKPGRGQEVLDAFAEISPLVHAETGCQLYAAHRQIDGDAVVMIERWARREDLQAHAEGEPLARLDQLLADVLVRPYDVWFLEPVPLGDEMKGRLPWPTA